MLTLLNYKDKKVEFDVDIEKDDVLTAVMEVVSGDEVLKVIYRDGTIRVYDSDRDFHRITDFCDGGYVVVKCGEWEVDKDMFLARKSSYDWERW